ncbi:type I methionyl aminopeptidase [Pseudobacteriovorax antillogorgiicola]|uniref:Methionine aminopeptidase n=1 Tax=Pseudobacteriovorax antillogorgiicola TaxID=1513793 RepID=A0A1Y6CK97_9BACT|nr:type I methionyl aminopeptidase [Pseudobacteriovorax antillogorgiicola]TCS45618.1 methionine aminopeptidase type I [Pseudobacteriovorax antillogorgiicola]SMF72413.1 methionine aminopeptidase, type I [Pseudobacteriovorax antillogorgiicola]
MVIENEKQLKAMEKIGAIVANCLQLAKAKARPGMTTKELDAIAGAYLDKHGAVSAPISCYKFPGHVCISVEKEAAHGIPGDRVLQAGDLINVDVSAHLDGYFADNGESFIIGGHGGKVKNKLCKTIKNVLDQAILQARAGVRIAEVGRTVEQLAQQSNLTVIRNLGGHGIGKTLHENPEFIASYFDRKDHRRFKEGMCVAIEPFLSNGGDWVEESSDGWTLYQDRYYAVQKEHTIMITKGKPVVLTQPTENFES